MASILLPDSSSLLLSSSFNTQALDASTDGAGAVYIAPRTGNITEIGVLQTAKTGTAPTYRYGVEGVTTTRAPDGTYKGGTNAYVDEADPATAFAWRTLGAAAAVTAGDLIAATVRYNAGTVDGSNFIALAIRVTNGAGGGQNHPFALTLTAGTWAQAAFMPIIALKYDDGTVIGACCPATSLTNNNAWNSGTSPVYRGSGWIQPVTRQCIGAWIAIRLPDNNVHSLHCFAGAASSPAASTTIDSDTAIAANSSAAPAFIPLVPFTCTAGTTYRWVLEPTTANNPTTSVHAVFDSAASLKAYFGDLFGTTGVAGSPPTWTDYNNGTDGYRAYMVIPVFDDVTVSAGGGGGQRVIGS